MGQSLEKILYMVYCIHLPQKLHDYCMLLALFYKRHAEKLCQGHYLRKHHTWDSTQSVWLKSKLLTIIASQINSTWILKPCRFHFLQEAGHQHFTLFSSLMEVLCSSLGLLCLFVYSALWCSKSRKSLWGHVFTAWRYLIFTCMMALG